MGIDNQGLASEGYGHVCQWGSSEVTCAMSFQLRAGLLLLKPCSFEIFAPIQAVILLSYRPVKQLKVTSSSAAFSGGSGPAEQECGTPLLLRTEADEASEEAQAGMLRFLANGI